MFIVKPLIIFLTGCFVTTVLTWSSYEISVSSLRSNERKIVTEITTQLQITLDITVGQVFMPILMGIRRGEISPSSFKALTDPILDESPTTTSVGWVPIVEPGDRDEFVANSSLIYPNFTLSIIGDFGEILPRPVDNTTMWPLLHANPILNNGFRGVDLHYGLWTSPIDLMVAENRTVISDLLDLTELVENEEGIVTNQRSVFQLLHPVFDIETYKLIGTFNRLFFPSRIIIATLETSAIREIDTYQISMFRINDNDVKESVYIQTSTGKLMKTGKNVYREVREISNNIFIVELISETVPAFETYGIILLVSLFATIVISRMYFIQMRVSKNNKDMSEKYKKATDMKSIFLAEMSHELRTPLNGIIGTIDILNTMSIGLEFGEYLRDIKACGDMLLTIIAGILDFSKIEAGKVTLDIAPMDIDVLIKDTARVLVQSIRESRNVDVILNIESIPKCEVVGDENRFRQIFMNLMSNALKFTKEGSIQINISSTSIGGSTRGTYLDGKCEKSLVINLEIKDTGIGIEDHRVKDIFQPFSQLNTGKLSGGGTGLGLIITRNMCESMNGSVSFTSVYNKGSCFSCNIVVGIPSRINLYNHFHKWSLIKNISEEVKDIETGIVDNSHDVLIVDDVHVNRKVVGGMLKINGIEFHMAPDGVKALELCKKNKYKLILMDYYMPGMTGVEVAANIRADESNINNDSVIIGLTASHTVETLESIMNSGMNGYELKPIRKNVIDELCHKYINI